MSEDWDNDTDLMPCGECSQWAEKYEALAAEHRALTVEVKKLYRRQVGADGMATFLGKPIDFWFRQLEKENAKPHPAAVHPYDTGEHFNVEAHRKECAAAKCKRCCDSGTVQLLKRKNRGFKK